ncbi:transcriptional regulator of RNA polII, SAGA, subunit-domain-containing protein [Gautieria morchelliformis]|nr:transcriptional regulator of RNA polII, SAGA, subunit-domain-containing protein [Gautieria morchelliformis]
MFCFRGDGLEPKVQPQRKMNPSSIRTKLASTLGQDGRPYWRNLSQFLSGDIPRYEFEENIRECINTPELAQLHNTLVTSLLSSAALLHPPTPPPDVSKPHRKRGSSSLRAKRLKSWAVGVGKKERERIKSLEAAAAAVQVHGHKDRDEIALGRSVRLIPEGRDPPGTHLPQHLCSLTRTVTQQSIAERIALISAQNNLAPPNKAVSQLVILALEAKLKHLVTHAISLTSTSRTISSIQPSSSASSRPLSASSFDTLFTLAPAVLPYHSAAAMHLALGEDDYGWAGEGTDKGRPDERHSDDPRYQMLTVLRSRSAVKDMIAKGR